MLNIKMTTISVDGQMVRLSTMYDVLTEEGKNVSTNNRLTRAVTSKAVLDAIEVINNYLSDNIEEDK